jgi:tripartite-type tricarboxylate transporter receptor subunit TctC
MKASKPRRAVTAALLTAPLWASIQHGQAQQRYPSKPVKIVVSGPPGPPFDIVSRVVAASLAERLGQGFVVENRPGASGFIGMQHAARAEADGYTLVAGGLGLNVLPPVIFRNLPLDPMKAFVPVAFFGDMYNVFIVREDSPIRSMKDLLQRVKENPGAVSIGSHPPGSSPHMGYALLAQQTDTRWTYVPYKGPNEVLADVMAGVLDVGTSQLPSYAGIIKSGRVRALAVSAATRSDILPTVPTMAEAGVPNHVVSSWLGLFAVAGTPQPIVEQLSKEIEAGLAQPETQAKLESAGFAPRFLNPQEFARKIDQEFAMWSDVAQRAGISMDFGK